MSVVVNVEVLVLMVRLDVRLARSSLNGRMYFLWHLSLMSVKANISNVGGRFYWDDDASKFFEFAFVFR